MQTNTPSHTTFDPSHLRDIRDCTSLPGVVGWQTFESKEVDDNMIHTLNESVVASNIQFVEVENDGDTLFLLLVNDTFFATPDPKVPTWYSDTPAPR